jgi:hypothetical protein
MKATFLSVFVWSFIGISTVVVPFSIKSKTTETANTTTTTLAAPANTEDNSRRLNGLDASRVTGANGSNKVSSISPDSKDTEPFRASANENNAILVTVPAGKLFVVEWVSGYAITSGSNSENQIILISSSGPTYYFIAPSYVNPIGENKQAFYTHLVRFYVLPGERLTVAFPSFSSGRSILVSGYFVNEP